MTTAVQLDPQTEAAEAARALMLNGLREDVERLTAETCARLEISQ